MKTNCSDISHSFSFYVLLKSSKIIFYFRYFSKIHQSSITIVILSIILHWCRYQQCGLFSAGIHSIIMLHNHQPWSSHNQRGRDSVQLLTEMEIICWLPVISPSRMASYFLLIRCDAIFLRSGFHQPTIDLHLQSTVVYFFTSLSINVINGPIV